ncbi:hypothetical protein MMC16_005806 [Acarospora aff. strigata]|nr:hypothetical protein [Acarospora aff. strigata]
MGLFDVLTVTISRPRKELEAGSITSVAIVEAYLAQIQRPNHAGTHLNAMLSEAELLAVEVSFDQERAAGQVSGPLHGIPIALKDAFATHPGLGMNTTVDSYALLDSNPSDNAVVGDAV